LLLILETRERQARSVTVVRSTLFSRMIDRFVAYVAYVALTKDE
jgi:hypothetical protein